MEQQGSWTFVDAFRDNKGEEQFVINDTDAAVRRGRMNFMTEEQFREVFRSRGKSDSEIEDLVARARMPKKTT